MIASVRRALRRRGRAAAKSSAREALTRSVIGDASEVMPDFPAASDRWLKGIGAPAWRAIDTGGGRGDYSDL